MDARILDLLNRRMRLVAGIADIKRAARIPVYAPEREEKLLRALASRNRGPMKEDDLRAVYREILSVARAAEEPVRVAYPGSEAAFTQLAARARFGSRAVFVPVRTIADVFAEVERGKSDYGVVPAENPTEGVVTRTLDLFVDSDVKICAEDLAGNHTRFLVLARSWRPRTGRDKTSIMFAIKDRVGALRDMLQPFRRQGVNLTSIESRPSRRRAGEYHFFVDCAGHVDDRRVRKALDGLEKRCRTVKLLGSYAAAA